MDFYAAGAFCTITVEFPIEKKARQTLRRRAKSNSWRRLEETNPLYRTAPSVDTFLSSCLIFEILITGVAIYQNGILVAEQK
jgi:hypothetical protein